MTIMEQCNTLNKEGSTEKVNQNVIFLLKINIKNLFRGAHYNAIKCENGLNIHQCISTLF